MAEPVQFVGASSSTDPRVVFPDWPAWAYRYLRVGTFMLDASKSPAPFVWSIQTPDTPEMREAIVHSPNPVTISNDERTGHFADDEIFPVNTLKTTVTPGDPWRKWAAFFAPLAPDVPDLQRIFGVEEDLEGPLPIPTPNDMLPDASLLQRMSFDAPLLLPAIVLDDDDEDGFTRRLSSAPQQFPHLFPEALEVV